MPFGLTNAPSTFQRMTDVLLAGLKWISCLVYLDDIVVVSDSIPQHLTRLDAVLKRLSNANLKLKLSVSVFAATRLKILGYVVSGEGLSPDQAKVDAVICFPNPKSVKDVLSFIGLCSYYRQCIAKPLTNLTKKRQPFVWTDAQEKIFQTLKTANNALVFARVVPIYLSPFFVCNQEGRVNFFLHHVVYSYTTLAKTSALFCALAVDHIYGSGCTIRV